MTITETEIKGLYIIEPRVFEDSRGYFFESFNKNHFVKAGLEIEFIQDNQSRSQYGVIRGLHFQAPPHSQTKLIRVLEGEIFDVALDLRKDSDSYGRYFGLNLSAEDKKQLLIPKGFAHGFSVLSEYAVVLYKCDDFYHPETEGGIAYNDPSLNIDWKIPEGKELVSEKDKKLPQFDPVVHIFE
jgi:dTDP-4-dehydrorhamnose 3,5-epimerase